MFHVYVLWSEKLRKRYVGSTENVRKRSKEHNQGSSTFTSGGAPWILIHQEEFENKKEARGRENFLKGGSGRAWLDRQFPQFRRGAGVA
ncbi:MAG: GIY-YIG nuclease family protein [Candidatus Kryptoniota bacterium]